MADLLTAGPTNSWKPDDGEEIFFAVERIRERHVNRLAPHKRYNRPGARIDNTGADPKFYELTLFFFNSTKQESGIDGTTQYPDNLNKFCDSFDSQETGTLTLVTRGPRRCKAESYERTETKDVRDAAAVTAVFLADNEDDSAAADFQAPSAKSVAESLAFSAIEACEDAGITSEDLISIGELTAQLVGYANFPGDFVGEYEQLGNQIVSSIEKVEDEFAKNAQEAVNDGETLLTQPEKSRGLRLLRRLADVIPRLGAEQNEGADRIISVTYDVPLSIYDVAVRVSQDAGDLLAINKQLPDPLLIPPRVPVFIRDTQVVAA
jgi:hypothetical protein